VHATVECQSKSHYDYAKVIVEFSIVAETIVLQRDFRGYLTGPLVSKKKQLTMAP
jgi:hypothetical protein